MLKERLTATLLQDRKRMRRLFLKYDENNRGYLKPAQLHRLLCDLGCDITLGEVLLRQIRESTDERRASFCFCRSRNSSTI